MDAARKANRTIENRADEFGRDHVSRPAAISSRGCVVSADPEKRGARGPLRLALRLSDCGCARRIPIACFRSSGCASSKPSKVIGELVDPAFSFMGGIYSARKVREELAPQIVERAETRARRCVLPGPRLTRLSSVRWTDCTSGRRSGNPNALYDLGARHYAIGQAAARGVRKFPARPSDRAA